MNYNSTSSPDASGGGGGASKETSESSPCVNRRAHPKEKVVIHRCSPKPFYTEAPKGAPLALTHSKSECTNIVEAWKRRKHEVKYNESGDLRVLNDAIGGATIVHISAHMGDTTLGKKGSILFVSESDDSSSYSLYRPSTFRDVILGQMSTLKVVILNGCNSFKLAISLAESGIPYVIAWRTSCADKASEIFSFKLHERLSCGDRPHEAFCEAKRHVSTVTRKSPHSGFKKKIEKYVFMDPFSEGLVKCTDNINDEKKFAENAETCTKIGCILEDKRSGSEDTTPLEYKYRIPVGIPAICGHKSALLLACSPKNDPLASDLSTKGQWLEKEMKAIETAWFPDDLSRKSRDENTATRASRVSEGSDGEFKRQKVVRTDCIEDAMGNRERRGEWACSDICYGIRVKTMNGCLPKDLCTILAAKEAGRKCISTFTRYSVLHISAHMNETLFGEPTIVMASSKGKPGRVDQETLAKTIARYAPDLVFLNGCESESLGIELVKRGVRNVVAFRTISLLSSGYYFAKCFYERYVNLLKEGRHLPERDAYHYACRMLENDTRDSNGTPADKLGVKKFVVVSPDERHLKKFDLYHKGTYMLSGGGDKIDSRTPSGVPVFLSSPPQCERKCGWDRKFDERYVCIPRRDEKAKTFREQIVRFTEELICQCPKACREKAYGTMYPKAAVFSVHGMTGVGKSACVREWLNDLRVRMRFDAPSGGGIFWLNANNENKEEELRKFAHDLLAMHVVSEVAAREEYQEMLQKNRNDMIKELQEILTGRWRKAAGLSSIPKDSIWDDLESVRPILIVLDDVFDSDVDFCKDIANLPLPLGSAIVMTHQDTLLRFKVVEKLDTIARYKGQLELKSMSEDDAITFFKKLCDIDDFDDDTLAQVKKVAKSLGNHTLAMKIVGLDIRMRSACGESGVWKKYAEILEDDKKDFSDVRSRFGNDASFFVSVRRSVSFLSDIDGVSEPVRPQDLPEMYWNLLTRQKKLEMNGGKQRKTVDFKEHYRQLSIFSKNARVPLVALARIWGVKTKNAEKIANAFVDRALLERECAYKDASGTTVYLYYLHDLCRRYVRYVTPKVSLRKAQIKAVEWLSVKDGMRDAKRLKGKADCVRWEAAYDAIRRIGMDVQDKETTDRILLAKVAKVETEYLFFLHRALVGFGLDRTGTGNEDQYKKRMAALCEGNVRKVKNVHEDKPHWQVAVALHLYGVALREAKDAQKALNILNKCLEMKREVFKDIVGKKGGHREIFVTLQELAHLSEEIGDREQAMNYLKEALEMSKNLYHNAHSNVAKLWQSIGMVHDKEKKHNEAHKAFTTCVDIMREALTSGNDTGDTVEGLLPNFLRKLGKAKALLGMWKDAQLCFEESKRLCHGSEDFKGEIDSCIDLFRMHGRKAYALNKESAQATENVQEEYEKAREQCKKAEELLKKINEDERFKREREEHLRKLKKCLPDN